MASVPPHQYDRLYEAVEESMFSDGRHPVPLMQKKFRLLLALLRPGRLMLDLGCGPAELIRDAADRNLFERYVGVDDSAKGIEIARKFITDPRVDLHVNDLAAFMEAWGEKADAVVCSDVLEHVPEAKIVETLEHIRRHTNPGADLLITVPNAYGDRVNRIAHRRWLKRTHPLDAEAVGAFPDQHISLFPWRKWRRLLRQHGFEPYLFRSVGFPVFSSDWLCRRLPWAGLCWLIAARRR